MRPHLCLLLSLVVLVGCDREPGGERRAPEPTTPPSLAGPLADPIRTAAVDGALAGVVNALGAPDDAAAPDAQPAGDPAACEPRRVLRTVAEPDRAHAMHFQVVDFDKVAYLVASDGTRARRLVSPTGRQHTDLIPNTSFLMLADGRPVYMGTDGLGQYISVDGERYEAHEDVWYLTVDDSGQHVTWAALREGRWSAYTDGTPVGGWHDGVDYPRRLADGSVAMTVTDGATSRLVRVDPDTGLVPTRSPEAAGELSRGPARVDEVDGTHLLTTARPADGKKRRLVLLDDQVIADCKEAVALGFAPRSTTPLYACQDDDQGWTLHAGEATLGGPYPTRPRIHYAPGPRSQGADAPHVILAGGIAETGGERIVDDASYIYEATLSPDGERVAMLVEHDLAEVHLALYERASGELTRWSQTLPVKAPDVKLGDDWGHFSPDGQHFGFAYAGRVVVDDQLVVDDVADAALRAVTADGRPLILHKTTLRLGAQPLAEDVKTLLDTELTDDGRVRWAAWTGTEVVAGCVAP